MTTDIAISFSHTSYVVPKWMHLKQFQLAEEPHCISLFSLKELLQQNNLYNNNALNPNLA